ncbi:hypothetical protein GQ53DRAFT_149551 [Thozetella sp. PMI_491]|nr:hypothetical protein GQ53DRAFT_149551 [Thozetella sp. PMI_491]
MLPFVEVSHLPSASSFYAAILDPLGLQFLLAHSASDPIPSITYGCLLSRTPVLQLRQVPASGGRPLKRSHLVLTATSAAAVSEFSAAGLRANPDSPAPIGGPLSRAPRRPSAPSLLQASEAPSAATAGNVSGEIRATVTDLDGNTMDVVYRPPPGYPSQYNGSTVRKTQSTDDEANRILRWNYDVASSASSVSSPLSEPPHAAYAGSHISSYAGPLTVAKHSPSRYGDDEPYLVRRVTTTTTTTTAAPSAYEASSSPRQNSRGLSAGAVVGTLLGVAAGAAAGAALTLTAMRSDRARAPNQEFDAPPFTRRATFPEPYPDRKGRFVEVERTVEKVRYPEAYPVLVDHRGPPPEYIARYRSSGSSKSKGLDDMALDDSRSRHSEKSRHSSTRTRSEAATGRKPLLLGEADHRSQISSSKTSTSRHPPIVQRSYTYDSPGDKESYVSARSHRSASTIRPLAAPVSTHTVTRSKAGSRATARVIELGADSSSQVYRSLSHAGSHISARRVPLPPSGVGSSHADWDDDADSVAPSDSISCVGSRRSGRSYRH